MQANWGLIIIINDRYVSAQEMENIKIEYGQKIIKFLDVQEQILEWYDCYQLRYPDSCMNNYRDSWYHYRKLWPEHSYIEVIHQTSTLDEHLQRAEKDAVVNFFQLVSQNLEFWYLVNDINIEPNRTKVFEQTLSFDEKNTDFYGYEWLEKCWRYFERNEEEASFAIIYAVQKYLYKITGKFYELQVLLHNIKNCTLQIRMNSSDIKRLEQPGEYIDITKGIYESLNEFMNKDAYFYLFSIHDVVRVNVEHSK